MTGDDQPTAGPGRGRISLRTRLLAGMALVAAVLVAIAVMTTVSTRSELVDQLDDRLVSFAPGDRPVRAVPDHTHEDGRGPERGGRTERLSDLYEGYLDADGMLRARFLPNVLDGTFSPPAVGPDDVPPRGSRIFTAASEDGSTDYRVLVQPVGGVALVSALPMDDVQRTTSRLVAVELIGVSIILVVLGLVTWWVLHLGIRPVNEMADTATRIAEGDLTVELPDSAPGTESGRLAGALNRMLARIRDALDERAESEARLRRFVADASHELRTPVTTIRGYAELYRLGALDEPGALDDAMRRTEQESARMGRLIEDMLVLARLDEERPMQFARRDLAALARDAVGDASAAVPGRPLTAELPPYPVDVDCDEDRLRQVIANTLGNALVHTGPEVAVTVRVRSEAAGVVLEVADAGDGMPPDVVERVTERFYRADPARSRHRGGSGLGLSIVAAVLEAHGGRLEIDSEPGLGTTVRIVLPHAVTPAPSAAARSAAAPSAPGSGEPADPVDHP